MSASHPMCSRAARKAPLRSANGGEDQRAEQRAREDDERVGEPVLERDLDEHVRRAPQGSEHGHQDPGAPGHRPSSVAPALRG
jgi:hypothetical protein